MGLFGNVKKLTSEIKVSMKKQREIRAKERAEKREYQRHLKADILKSRREAYTKEAIKQSQLKAVRDAKMRFNPQSSPEATQKQKNLNKLLWDL